MRWLDGISVSVGISLSKCWEIVKNGKPGVLQSTGSQSWTWLSDWTTTKDNNLTSVEDGCQWSQGVKKVLKRVCRLFVSKGSSQRCARNVWGAGEDWRSGQGAKKWKHDGIDRGREMGALLGLNLAVCLRLWPGRVQMTRLICFGVVEGPRICSPATWSWGRTAAAPSVRKQSLDGAEPRGTEITMRWEVGCLSSQEERGIRKGRAGRAEERWGQRRGNRGVGVQSTGNVTQV